MDTIYLEFTWILSGLTADCFCQCLTLGDSESKFDAVGICSVLSKYMNILVNTISLNRSKSYLDSFYSLLL